MHRVLVVDDDPDTTATFRTLLEGWGHKVAAANDGPSALAQAEAFQPDVALVDIRMDEMGGFELARRLRALPGVGHALLVAVTALRGCEPDGVFDLVLLKPVAPDELKRLLDALAVGRASEVHALVWAGEGLLHRAREVSQEAEERLRGVMGDAPRGPAHPE